MNTVETECIGYAESNPDISGVGVRISFYLQAFLLVLLVDRSWQDAPIALWTFIATSAGLVLAAVILRDNLTFFQALQASNLVWLANFGTFFSLASYSRQKAASHKDKTSSPLRAYDFKVKFGAMCQSLVSMALTIYMWTSAKTFGPLKPECAQLVKYVFFVIEVQASSIGRTVSLIVTCLLTTVYVLITLQELYSYRQSYGDSSINKPRQSTSSSVETSFPQPVKNSSILAPSVHKSSKILDSDFGGGSAPRPQHPAVQSSRHQQSPLRSRSVTVKRRPKRRRWSSDLDPMLVGIIICQIMVFTYFIVSTELLLKRNPSNDNSANQWSFGQILALIVIIPSALSLAGAMNEHGVKRLSKHKKREVRARERKRHEEDPESAVSI